MEQETPRQKTEAALPFLVKMGVAKRCELCPPVRELVNRLNGRERGVGLVVDEGWEEDKEVSVCDVRLKSPIKVSCSACLGTGVVPTENGWRLLGFVKRFMEQASGCELDKIEEIPF